MSPKYMIKHSNMVLTQVCYERVGGRNLIMTLNNRAILRTHATMPDVVNKRSLLEQNKIKYHLSFYKSGGKLSFSGNDIPLFG